MVYQFIRSQAGEFPVKAMCRVLDISRSCYYAYCNGIKVADKEIASQTEKKVLKVFYSHSRRYGIRRLIPELSSQGLRIGQYKLRGILRRYGLKAIQPRSFVPKTTNSRHPYLISPNLLKDIGFPVRPDQVWVGDITYIPISGGKWVYLAVWMDLFSRKIVGWQLRDHMREELIMEAFTKALTERSPERGLIVHSDRGGQYAGARFRKMLDAAHINQSMSEADNPYDNAHMESYFSRFKAELLEGGAFENMEDARTEIFEYIHAYYNPIRRHSALAYISPEAFEQQYYYQQKQEVS